jgi:hypothetical protein
MMAQTDCGKEAEAGRAPDFVPAAGVVRVADSAAVLSQWIFRGEQPLPC